MRISTDEQTPGKRVLQARSVARRQLVVALVAMATLAIVAAGCDTAPIAGSPADDPAAAPGDGAGPPATGMCAQGVPDCVDVVIEPDARDAEVLRDNAQALVGRTESELASSVRVGRRGDEQFALTEDYVVGRITVELDERAGDYVVTAVVLELPDGPETFTG